MARRQLRKSKKKPLIVICSEGGKKSSEYYYFRNHTSRDLRIQFSTGNSTDPKGMLDDLLKQIHSDDEEVVDTFDMDINSLKDNLDFDLNIIILYAVYAILMSDTSDKFKQIDGYIKDKIIDIRDCQNLGIEEVPDLDEIYNEWLKYKNN